MLKINELTTKIYAGQEITKREALELYNHPLEELCTAANEIRLHYCGNKFDICTIINGKSGKCSENCKFCAQSSFYETDTKAYPFLAKKELIEQARYNYERGVLRYSIVTSGRALNNRELAYACDAFRAIKSEVGIEVCASFGLLNVEQFRMLKAAGVHRIHNNLETSRKHFPNVCTTHTYDDKLASIRAAMAAGIRVCSGGLMGMGETVEDRIDMGMELRNLGISSVPINILSPIQGTPYESLSILTNEEMRRIIAVYRFLLPTASIRMAGGRGLLEDKGRLCFQSGANAAISGDLLTTSGMTIETDMKLLDELNYMPTLWDK